MTRKCLINGVLTLVTLIIALQAELSLAALTVTKDRDLSFGAFVPTSNAGTVTIAATDAGARTYTNVVLFSQGSGAGISSAKFAVTGGTANYICNITLPNINITRSGGTMALSFTRDPASTITLSSSGAGTIYVGGTINVSSSQTVGSYSGTLTITVDGCVAP